MPNSSPEEVRAALQPAFDQAVRIAATSPHRLQEHIDARRAADALDTLARTLTGRPLRYPKSP